MEDSSRGKPQLKVATMGHAGHGKTTLTAAINHVLSMKGRAKKEGMLQGTDTHRTEYESDKRAYEHIDAPTDRIPDTVTSAAQFDGAILVVSAADGPMPQTQEHLSHAKQVGVPRLVVFLNFCDVVDDPELIELVQMEIRELLSSHDFPGDDTPVITGSALKALSARSVDDPWARKVIDLAASLDKHIPLNETRVQRAPQAVQAPRAAQMPQATQAPESARPPGAVPSFGERLRDLFGRKR
jgi:elongation factor Tu